MNPVLSALAPHVDAAFYLARNADVRAAGMPAAEHYWRMGWREGRDPSPWFATEYYLRSNPDVQEAGVNPLWHYAVRGRLEGRPARPPGGAWRAELARVAAPPTVPRGPYLRRATLTRRLAAACAGARGLVLSISHDRYTDTPGGTQLLIADEQRKFNGDRAAYLHLSPLLAQLGLTDATAAPMPCGVTLDGGWLGAVRGGDVLAVLAALPASLRRLLVVHALHGWPPEAVAALAAALRPAESVFWVHDYGAACPEPRLLRNGIAHCAAPPPDSMACRICVPGGQRPAHLARVGALFRAVPFHLAAPSRLAADTWRRASALPVRGVHVHPHATLLPMRAEPAAAEDGASPLRLAFVGHAAFHKGWGVFAELLGALRQRPRYRVFHIASAPELRPMDGVQPIAATSTPADPHGMRRALAAARIDLVLAPSPWPETFGYVAHEALAAGADIVTLADSGAVAALVRRLDRGVVLEDAQALTAFFIGPAAAEHVRRRRAAGRGTLRLLHDGSTATLSPAGTAARTDDPDLHVLASARRVDGTLAGLLWRCRLPGAACVRLRSRVQHPAWEGEWPVAHPRLGVAVAEIRLDGVRVAPGRGGGWHVADGLHWTDGDAALRVGAARLLEVRLARQINYWRAPLLA